MNAYNGLRLGCHGLPPLTARLEPWQVALLSTPKTLVRLVEEFGSPLNLHHTEPFEQNVNALLSAAQRRNIRLEILFARKANKALTYVKRARELGIGVDTASHTELTQCLDLGLRPETLVSTAAVKDTRLIKTCIGTAVPVVVDNPDELTRVGALAAEAGVVTPIILRISGFNVDGTSLVSRFGFHIDEVLTQAAKTIEPPSGGSLRLVGLHFHLDGYEAAHRIAGLSQSILLADALRAHGHPVGSIDIGGGLPMRYLDDPGEWSGFRHALDEALLGKRDPITYRNHGMGRVPVEGRILGDLDLYPYYQNPVAPEWLMQVLDASFGAVGENLSDALRSRRLVLRCEPGRSLVDGCGVTVARVEHRKRLSDGSWSIGLAMNRSQCATAKQDHAVDPLLVMPGAPKTEQPQAMERPPAMEGYLMGTLCTEADLLSRRRLRFPQGVAPGDLVVFPNTAGYLMHFVESRSHQFPLARNVVVGPGLEEFKPDPIDATQ